MLLRKGSQMFRFPVIIDTIGPANVTEWAADTCSLSSLCLTKVYHATKKDLAIGLTVDNEILVWRYNQFGPQRQLNGHLDWVECLVIVHRKPPRISESDPTNEEMEQSRSSIEKESVVKRVTFLERRASMAVEKKASMANIKRLTSPKQEPTSLLYTEIYSASADGAILKWLPSPGSNTDSWTQFEVAPSCHVSILSMIYDPNLDVLITGSSDCKIRIWNLDGQRSTSSATGPDVLCGHEDSVVGLCIINHVLISISYDRTLRWWDMATYLPLETIEMEPEVALVCLEYSPSRNELATCGTGGMIQVRHARHGKKLYLLEGGSGNIILVKWCASGGTWVSASDDGEISIWDPVSQSRLRSMCKKKELVTALLVDEENKLILFSMINDHTIRGYTMDLEEEMCAYVGHADQVHCMVYLSEKSLYISGSWDKTLRTWIAPNKLRQQAVQRSMSTQKEDSLDGSGIFHEVTPISTYEKEHPLIIPKTLESLGPVLQKRPESPAPQKVPSSRGSIRGSIKGSRGSVRGSISGLTVFSRGSSSTGSETEEKKLTLAMKLDDLEESLNHSIPCLYQDDYFHQ